MSRIFNKWTWPAILWAAVILTLTSIPKLSPPDLGFDAEDKLAHLLVYFIFGILMARAYLRDHTQGIQSLLFKATLVALLFAVFDEFHQLFIPGRVADVFDLSADILGIFIAMRAFLLLKRYEKE